MNHVRKLMLLPGAVALALISSAGFAHHSGAGVDHAKTVKVSGVLKEMDWSAPHAQVIVAATDANGKESEISVWTVAPAMLGMQGFKPKDFHVGEKVDLAYHPNRNGAPGGILASLKLADGRTVNGMADNPNP